MTDPKLDQEFNLTISKLGDQFGGELDMQGVLFLIGVQELGKGKRKFSKDQKLEVMHVAICTLLVPYGYYEYSGNDEEGWPHFNATAKLPHLKPVQQGELMKEAIVEYFRRMDEPLN
jgi:hypothetical protein